MVQSSVYISSPGDHMGSPYRLNKFSYFFTFLLIFLLCILSNSSLLSVTDFQHVLFTCSYCTCAPVWDVLYQDLIWYGFKRLHLVPPCIFWRHVPNFNAFMKFTLHGRPLGYCGTLFNLRTDFDARTNADPTRVDNTPFVCLSKNKETCCCVLVFFQGIFQVGEGSSLTWGVCMHETVWLIYWI